MEPKAQTPAALRDVPLSSTVRAALDSAAEQCDASRPLQTGMVLAALIGADAHGDWDRVWPSYDGAAEALLNSDDDENALASGDRWCQAGLSEDLLAALSLLAETARRYAMDPVQPGALALALASIASGSASRHMIRLSGYSRAELIDHIQSDLLGTSLEGFGDVAAPGAERPDTRPPALAVLAGSAAAIFCAFGAWQGMRLIVGPIAGAVLAAMVTVLVLLGVREEADVREAQLRRATGPLWSLANYLHPLKLITLLLVVGLLVFLVANHHRFESLYPLGLLVGSLGLAVVLLIGGFRDLSKRSARGVRKRRPPILPAGIRYHRIPIITAVVTGAVLILIASIARLGFLSSPLGPFSPPIYRWLRAALTGSGLGGWFSFRYWPVLAAMAAMAAGYLAGSAVWAASTIRHASRARVGHWRAAAALLTGLAVIAVGNLPASPLAYPAVSGPQEHVLYKFPNYPDALTVNNATMLSSLRWTSTGPAAATATGLITTDDCSPDCAQGTFHQDWVKVIFLDPRRCAVENAYLPVAADVFTVIEVHSAGRLPSYVSDRYTIIAGCT